MGWVYRSLLFSNAQTPPRVGTHLFHACGSSCNFLKCEALMVKGRGTEFCRRAARLRRPRHRCVPSRKVHGSFAHRSMRNACWALMRCRSHNSLGFDLISLAFFGPLFMAPGRFRPFPLPLLACSCSGRAKNRRGAGLVRSECKRQLRRFSSKIVDGVSQRMGRSAGRPGTAPGAMESPS